MKKSTLKKGESKKTLRRLLGYILPQRGLMILSLICAAALNGWIDRKAVVLESLIGLKRSGAKMIITYFAVEALREGWIR